MILKYSTFTACIKVVSNTAFKMANQKKIKGVIGILTGGGDVPGLNPAIRAVTIRANREDTRKEATHREAITIRVTPNKEDIPLRDNLKVVMEDILLSPAILREEEALPIQLVIKVNFFVKLSICCFNPQ